MSIPGDEQTPERHIRGLGGLFERGERGSERITSSGPGIATFFIPLAENQTGETDTMLFNGRTPTGKSAGAVMAQMNANRADKAFQKFRKSATSAIEQNIVTVDMASTHERSTRPIVTADQIPLAPAKSRRRSCERVQTASDDQ